ncbi:MAG: SUMF1/EgtB/PvdO family nonheme iron enzyme [Candidatus Thermoplasmatota archaeon]|nr:SUMF1/EgtB/PvdO family nonheme iron enzyme [Candidatus Thermoplasmatota archaeon]MDP7265919.1 SUMF1/EgtB/PvdO family nonheme iron enzyme [Candidatus Thermoplasmatota archaeon]
MLFPAGNGRKGSNRVIRGGSWNNTADNCESAYRNRNTPDNRNNNLGVRLVSSSLREKCSVHGCCAGTKEMTRPLSSAGSYQTKKSRVHCG